MNNSARQELMEKVERFGLSDLRKLASIGDLGYAAKQLQDLLPTQKDGRYIPVDMSRPNYKEKMERFGIRNFVCYDVTINGDVFELKCSVRKDSGNHNRVKEFPYSFKKKKDK